jgi:HORMA domain
MESQLLLPRQQKETKTTAFRTSQSSSNQQDNVAVQMTAILPEQSLAMVKIFLNAAIASILYGRELLKNLSPCFLDRCVADLFRPSGPVNYKDFLSLNSQASEGTSQIFKILVKGRNEQADKVLRLLVCIQITCLIA